MTIVSAMHAMDSGKVTSAASASRSPSAVYALVLRMAVWLFVSCRLCAVRLPYVSYAYTSCTSIAEF